MGVDPRSETLGDVEVSTEFRRQTDGGRAGRLVFADAEVGCEHAGTHGADLPIDPGPDVVGTEGIGVGVDGGHFGRLIELGEGELGAPLGQSVDEHPIAVETHPGAAGGNIDLLDVFIRAPQPRRESDDGVPGEAQLP